MNQYEFEIGAVDKHVTFRAIVISTGMPKTDLVAADITATYWPHSNVAPTAISLSDLAAITTAHSDGGIKHIAAGNYRLDIPDGANAAGDFVDIEITGGSSDWFIEKVRIIHRNYNPNLEPGVIDAGLVQSATTNSIQFRSALALANDIPNGAWVTIEAGTGFGQSRFLPGYTGATDTAVVDPVWVTVPDTTSRYKLRYAPPAPISTLPDVNTKTTSAGALTSTSTDSTFTAEVLAQVAAGLVAYNSGAGVAKESTALLVKAATDALFALIAAGKIAAQIKGVDTAAEQSLAQENLKTFGGGRGNKVDIDEEAQELVTTSTDGATEMARQPIRLRPVGARGVGGVG